MYRIEHPAIGHPPLAAEVAESLAEMGRHIQLDHRRGLDHGAWVPLRYLDPKARIPSLQVSLRSNLDAAGAVRLGRALLPWRRQGVAIIGSGSLTHNLHELRDGEPHDEQRYVHEFRDWVRDAVVRRDVDRLIDYRRLAPHARRAHPTEEHFHGALSMESYAWGLPAAAMIDEPAVIGPIGAAPVTAHFI